jgi:hypothetical protein
MNGDDLDDILLAFSKGLSVAEVSRKFGLTEDEASDTLKRAIARCAESESLRADWVMSGRRMLAIELKFCELALEGDGNATAAAIAIKANERRSALTGSNAEIGHTVRLLGSAPAKQHSATTMLEAFNRLAHDPLYGGTPKPGGDDNPGQN